MGGTTYYILGVLCLLAGGALYFEVSPVLSTPVHAWAGTVYGLVPAGLGILGLVLCGLGFIFKSDV